MKIYRANVSKSIELYQRVKFWLKEDKSFENVYQALSHDDELSRKLFHEEVLICYGFVSGPRERYFNRHCFFIEDDEVIDVTFNSRVLRLQQYNIVECFTLSEYLDLVEYECHKYLNEMKGVLD